MSTNEWAAEAKRLGISNQVVNFLFSHNYSLYKHKSKQQKGFTFSTSPSPKNSLMEISLVSKLIERLPQEHADKSYLMVVSGFTDVFMSAEYSSRDYARQKFKENNSGILPRFVLFESNSLVNPKLEEYFPMKDNFILTLTENEIFGAVKALVVHGYQVGIQPRVEGINNRTYDFFRLNSEKEW